MERSAELNHVSRCNDFSLVIEQMRKKIPAHLARAHRNVRPRPWHGGPTEKAKARPISGMIANTLSSVDVVTDEKTGGGP